MSEQRSDPRVGVCLRVELTIAGGRRLRACSENLSRGGMMLSLEKAHEFSPGESLHLAFELPSRDPAPIRVQREATVRWCSELLPELLGVAFETPLSADEAALLLNLSATPTAK